VYALRASRPTSLAGFYEDLLQREARELHATIVWSAVPVLNGAAWPDPRLRVLYLPRPVTDAAFSIALHEIGHLVDPPSDKYRSCRRADGVLASLVSPLGECSAWRWARARAGRLWTVECQSALDWALGTYVQYATVDELAAFAALMTRDPRQTPKGVPMKTEYATPGTHRATGFPKRDLAQTKLEVNAVRDGDAICATCRLRQASVIVGEPGAQRACCADCIEDARIGRMVQEQRASRIARRG
jgi:hypothetical protein